MKKSISLINPDTTEKTNKIPKHYTCKPFLKPQHFTKFTPSTLFYIFYYMPRDSLQVVATDELYKRKWKYHVEFNVWFCYESDMSENPTAPKDSLVFFHPQDWEIQKYTFGIIDPKNFLTETELKKNLRNLNPNN